MFNYVWEKNKCVFKLLLQKGSHLVATETYDGVANARIVFFWEFYGKPANCNAPKMVELLANLSYNLKLFQ
jgi:hypothetical protein